MLGELINRVLGERDSQQWSVFVDSLFEQEDLLPPLHAPNVLSTLRTDLIIRLSESSICQYSYKKREERVLNGLYQLLSERMDLLNTSSTWELDRMEVAEATRLQHKIQQLILNKGYQLYSYTDNPLNLPN